MVTNNMMKIKKHACECLFGYSLVTERDVRWSVLLMLVAAITTI